MSGDKTVMRDARYFCMTAGYGCISQVNSERVRGYHQCEGVRHQRKSITNTEAAYLDQ